MTKSLESRGAKITRYPAGVSLSTVGAIGELKVSADLMARGFEVFRSLSPTASCDLLAARGQRFFRVEVRTGWELNGKVMVKRQGRYDVLAIVLPDRIQYEPPIDADPTADLAINGQEHCQESMLAA